MQPLNRYAVCTADVAHGGIATCADDINHCLVVFVHHQQGSPGQDSIPEIQEGHAAQAHGGVTRHYFGFGGRMRDTPLPLTDTCHREARVLTTDGKMVASRRPQGGSTPREVGIRIKMRLNRAKIVTHPANHS